MTLHELRKKWIGKKANPDKMIHRDRYESYCRQADGETSFEFRDVDNVFHYSISIWLDGKGCVTKIGVASCSELRSEDATCCDWHETRFGAQSYHLIDVRFELGVEKPEAKSDDIPLRKNAGQRRKWLEGFRYRTEDQISCDFISYDIQPEDLALMFWEAVGATLLPPSPFSVGQPEMLKALRHGMPEGTLERTDIVYSRETYGMNFWDAFRKEHGDWRKLKKFVRDLIRN